MILLDTHVWLWWLHSPEKLSDRSRTLLTIAENQDAVVVSAISVWEIALKHSAGKLPLPLSVDEWFAIAKTRRGITIEPVDPLDAIASTQLPGDFHKDPADRIIVAIAYRRNVEAAQLDELGRNHPQIPELLAYFTQDNQQYLVQEFIDGQNLADELKNNGAFDGDQIIALLNSLLPVLQFVHKKQVIHRDIKPENIIRRSNGELVLVDFGAAKIVTRTALAATGTVIGTAGYASPEQTLGKASTASDIYSLGVTCLHLLTMIEPFDLFDITEGEWIWRDYLPTPVSKNLGQVLDKMVEGAMKRRYQSADEVLQALSPPSKESSKANKEPPKVAESYKRESFASKRSQPDNLNSDILI